ncbi:SIMPL domain-containing protein [Brucellaceae bacterium C25G]
MTTRAKFYLIASLSLTAVAGSALVSVFPASAVAQENQMEKVATRITVTGEGEMNVAPDMALLNLSVLREAETARDALTQNNEAMDKVLSAMKEAGVEPRDLQTGGFNIQPRYIYPDDKNGLTQPKISGYSVSNSLSVRVRDLSKLGTILDTSVTLGVNQGGDVTFVNDNPSATITEARKRAVADAIAKAKTLTDAAGVGLGEVLEINETSRRPMPVPMARGKMMVMEAAAPADSVPMSAGENTYNISVTMTFSLKQ